MQSSDANRLPSARRRSRGPRRAPVVPSDVLGQIDVEALIDRLQAFALADTPGSLTDVQAAVALALLERMVPNLYQVELITSGSRHRPIRVRLEQGGGRCDQEHKGSNRLDII